MNNSRSIVAAILFFVGLPTSQAGMITLYNDSHSNLPQAQGWVTYIATNGAVATTSTTPLGAALNTGTGGTTSGEAGWFNAIPLPPILGGGGSPINPSFPILDPDLGFRLGFELLINSESHNNDNRAGFSVILLGEDLMGVEIGFWEDEIWAQSHTFTTHAESSGLFDTMTNEISYELTIQGMDYFLTGNGSSILSGATRYYGNYLTGATTPDPYEVPSFLFLGDDTDSAFASFTLGTVTLEHDLQLPTPPIWSLLLAGLAGVARVARHRT